VALTKRVKSKLVRDLRRAHRVGQILLVREHQKHRVAQLVFVQHSVQLIASFRHAIAIVAIHDEDQTLSVLEVVTPERSNLRFEKRQRLVPKRIDRSRVPCLVRRRPTR